MRVAGRDLGSSRTAADTARADTVRGVAGPVRYRQVEATCYLL